MSRGPVVRIRLPVSSLIIPVMVGFCSLPLATAGGAWSLMYLLPLAALAVVAYAGTTARAAGLTARWLRGRTRIAWRELDRIEFPGQRWAVAVTTDGLRVVLPAVRPRDLPRLAGAAQTRLFVRRPDAVRADESESPAPSSPEP